MRIFPLFFVVFGYLLGAAPWALTSAMSQEATIVSPLQSVLPEEIRQHTETLAGDAFEGREAGQAGGYAAATYIVKALQEKQIRPSGDGGAYFQAFGKGYRNILAMVPGSDERLASEYVLLTAHYDHVGYGSKTSSNGTVGSIHNGADDNASGVAGVLELAEALQMCELKRSVLIVFWDAEEKGLLGSKHWLKHPTVDLKSIRMMVNVDMIGRLGDRLQLFGSRTMPGLRQMWSQANTSKDVAIDFPWKVLNNSDHYEFFKRGIPIAMVHTGLHDDYHRASDDVHLLNYDGIQQITEVLLNLVQAIANQQRLPTFRGASSLEGKSEQRYYERPFQQQQRRLGLTVKTIAESDGLAVDSVWVGSPANLAGLQPGDIVLEANQASVSSPRDLREAIADSGGKIALKLKTADGEKLLNVKLAGKPQRIGVSWRTNDAEPGVVMLSGVVPGSPADLAGCKPLDRIIEVAGESPGDSERFRKRMTQAQGSLQLKIEREGRVQTLELKLPDAPSEKNAVQKAATTE